LNRDKLISESHLQKLITIDNLRRNSAHERDK